MENSLKEELFMLLSSSLYPVFKFYVTCFDYTMWKGFLPTLIRFDIL